MPSLASPLDETPEIITKKYDYYNFGSEWTATYCGGKPKRHVGADLGVEFVEGKDIPVYAAAAGHVKANYLCSSSYNWARGIVIDHGGTFTTVYEHINPLVSVGQYVDKGQQIATVAKIEGYQHLHFGIKCGVYEAISTRGALPVEHGPCDKKTDCSTSGCRCDPLFPGPFIDPLDTRIVYEQHGLSESEQSMISVLDNIPPIVQAFQVTPQSLTKGESFTIDYTVSDADGSGLNRVELWRKDEHSDWQEIKRDTLSNSEGPITGSISDAPSNSGRYWYGIHVADNSGNWNDERNSNSDNQPSGFSPIQVEVGNIQSIVSENNDTVTWNEKGVTLYNQGKYEEALECFNEATRINPKYAKAWDNKATVFLALDRCDEFKSADEMAGSLGFINFRNPLTYIKCG